MEAVGAAMTVVGVVAVEGVEAVGAAMTVVGVAATSPST